MPNFWGCRCCGQAQCACVKLSDFAEEDWDLCPDASGGSTNFAMADTLAQARSDDGLGSMTAWTEVDGSGNVQVKVRLQGTFSVANTPGSRPTLDALAYINLPLLNGMEFKWPTQFSWCWSHSGDAENVWEKTPYGSPESIGDTVPHVDVQGCFVNVKYPDAWVTTGPFDSDVQANNDTVDADGVGYRPQVSSELSITSSGKVNSILDRGTLVDRNGTALTPNENSVVGNSIADMLSDEWEDDCDWPLRFGVAVSFELEKGYTHEIDTTITIRNFRIGFPQRVQHACMGHLMEDYGVYGKWRLWNSTYTWLENDNYGSNYWPKSISPPESMGDPTSNPSNWSVVNVLGGYLTGAYYTSTSDGGNTVSRWHSGADCCKLAPAPDSFDNFSDSGHHFRAVYREICQEDKTYQYVLTVTLYYKVASSNTSRTIQVWEVVNPDFGAWNIAEPVSGYSDLLTDPEKANLSLMLAFATTNSTYGGPPLWSGATVYHLNASVGHGYP